MKETPETPFVALIGCPEHDIGPVEDVFLASPLQVRPRGVIEQGDRTLFCISCNDGPTQGTRQAVEALHGKSIIPIAIVLTYAELTDDDSLRSLITLEERVLLSRVLPESVVDELLVLHDFDPNLVGKIQDLMRSKTTEVYCSSAEQ